MNFNQERYFFISGIISVSLFIGVLFLAGFSLIHSPKIEQFAMIKSDVINVSIALSEDKPSEESVPVQEALQPEPEPLQKNEESAPAEEVPEISDLFAQVKPQKTSKNYKEENARREELSALEKELLERKESPRFSDKVSKVELARPSVKMVPQGGSTGPVVNEYHAKIQGLIYSYFRPPSGSAGEAARVRMNISASGKLMGYKVIRYSGNGTFNSEVDWLKDRLGSVRFPEHPEGKDTVLEFILTAKE